MSNAPSVSNQWFAVQIKANCLQIAERNLLRQGFCVFAPVQPHTVRSGSRFEQRLRPLFPGYLFVGFDPASGAWRSINNTLGVSRIVTFGRAATPAQVPPALIAALRERCDDNGCFRQVPALAPGDSVRVISGPFADFAARVESLAPQQRVWLLLELMGGTTRVAVAATDVSAEPAL